MPDHSHLDSRYFVDSRVYNCPFCNRRNVHYAVIDSFAFDWTDDKECYGFIAECSSCRNRSMHLSYTKLHIVRVQGEPHRFGVEQGTDLDALFFYSVPTSLFALHSRIPKSLRELITEAEGCLKSNFLTGASACVRKVIYELAVLQKAEGEDYEERVKSLKKRHPEVPPEYFDTLVTIQQLTSDKVHEDAYDGWSSAHLRLLLSTLLEVLQELFVIPQVRLEKRQAILKLRDEVASTQQGKQRPPRTGK